MPFLISDGLTLDGSLPPRPGIHDGLRFKYRPALPAAVYDYQAATRMGNGADRMKAVSKLLVAHLAEWDAGEPISDASFRRVPQPDLERLLDFVTVYTSAEIEGDLKNSPPASVSK